MSTRWLSVVGLGEDGLEGLSPAARTLVDTAEVLIGGARHLAMVPADDRERLTWPSPLRLLIDTIAEMRGRRVCVLATGDPMCFGIGTTLARRVPIAEMIVIPAPSAFALAHARLGWTEQETRTLTLHGRPLDMLNLHVQPGAKLLILSENASTPALVAARLNELGYPESRITVFEHMDGARENSLAGTAGDWPHPAGADLNTIAVDCIAGPSALIRPLVPGLPDEAFHNDGQLTKREVRAATLAALAPGPGQYLWDVGAGCGSIAIEWMRTDALATATAIEPRAERRTLIADNAAALGVPKLDIRDGSAPDALVDLPTPDAIFIGGGITSEGTVQACWSALKPGGRLVANVVTLEGEAGIMQQAAELGGTLTRIAISRAEPIGPYHGWKPLMPVTQWAVTKKFEDTL